MQCACAILSCCGLSGCAIFFHKISKAVRFSKKGTEHKMCVLIFCTTLSLTFLILRRIERDVIKNVYWFSCKVSVIIVILYEAWGFSTDFRKILKYQISWKSVQWGPRGSMRTGRRTDTTKLTSVFRNFANAPKKGTEFIESESFFGKLIVPQTVSKFPALFEMIIWRFP